LKDDTGLMALVFQHRLYHRPSGVQGGFRHAGLHHRTRLRTVSAGIATMADCGGDLEALMQRADQALYAAKVAGRNRMCGLALER
jgi:PleD family two-component response regulator